MGIIWRNVAKLQKLGIYGCKISQFFDTVKKSSEFATQLSTQMYLKNNIFQLVNI